jgi:haloalkane dehalogenase
MNVLRTPDERFDGLADWPHPPRWLQAGALRMAAYDVGPPDGHPVVMLHGEPSWSYLWRKVIAVVAGAGLRAIAIDLVGFGRSDKPAARDDYTYARHVEWLRAALDALSLPPFTMVCQDWGGLLGLRIVGEEPHRVARVVAANTLLPTGDQPPGPGFLRWRQYSQETPVFHAGGIVKGGTARGLAAAAIAAYDAPFPDDAYLAGARRFPMLVPIAPDDPAAPANRRAWEGLRAFAKPFLTIFGDSDPVTRGADAQLQALISGAAGRRHATLERAGHFLQEDAGAELGARVVDFIATEA